MAQSINFNKHKNLLILGKAATNNYRKTIVYADNYNKVYNAYGDSDLTEAYKIAKDLGAPYVFLCNCRYEYDYLELADTLRDSDFAYIVPISIYISDEFDEPKTERKISYVEYLLEKMGNYNESVFIVTDKKAELYDTIDNFIKASNDVANNIKKKLKYPANPEDLVFVVNNLSNYKMANLPLAVSLCVTEPYEYPQVDFGNAIFLLDQYEDIGNWAYFQNHNVRPTTVENLLNFKNICPEKIVFISRIIKIIKRELDFSDYVGKQYSEYRRLNIQTKLQEYLDSIMNTLIYKYNIIHVKAYKANTEKLSVIVENVFEIWPINSTEKVTISQNVEVC